MNQNNLRLLPVWGPYSKKYMGLSRVMSESRAFIHGMQIRKEIIFSTAVNSYGKTVCMRMLSFSAWKMKHGGSVSPM